MKRQTITAKQLRDALAGVPDDYEVRVWLPGSTISLSSTWAKPSTKDFHIEGNVDPGSALDRLQMYGAGM